VLHHHKDTEEEGDHGIPGEDIWSQKWGQQISSTAGGRWMWQLKTELDREKWSVTYAALGVTWQKSCHYLGGPCNYAKDKHMLRYCLKQLKAVVYYRHCK